MKRSFACVAVALIALAGVCGPKISIFGDSYSTYEGVIPKGNAIWYFAAPRNQNDVTKAEECWWSIAIKLLNGTLERNESWSGSTVCNTGYYGKDFSGWSFVDRTGRLGDPDLILFCGATNDSWAHSPIGDYKYADWTIADRKAFRPALAETLATLKRLYPKAKVWFVLNDCLSEDINESVHAICAHYQVPCVNLKGIAKQKGHPSVAGMKSIGEQVAAAVKISDAK